MLGKRKSSAMATTAAAAASGKRGAKRSATKQQTLDQVVKKMPALKEPMNPTPVALINTGTEIVQQPDDTVFIIQEFEEIVEHICARCEQQFPSFEVLKLHLPDCRKQALAELQAAEGIEGEGFEPKTETKVIKLGESTVEPELILSLDIEKSKSVVMQEETDDFDEESLVTDDEQRVWEEHNDPDTCYCCGESKEFSHLGHIKCKKCPKSFRDPQALVRHRFILHSSRKDFECDKCNAFCANFAFYTLHMEAHKTGKPFSCKRCGKDFTRKFHLERHLKYLNCDGKTPIIKHVCNVCNASFRRHDSLKQHLVQHVQPKEKTKSFQCTYCDKAFVGNSLLEIHIRTHTGEKPFICDFCKNGFPSNAALRKHRRTHTGEKPYECPDCGNKFAARETLNRHKKTHTGDFKYVCQHCDAKFIQNSQLKNHMKVHDSSITFDCKECDTKCKTIRALAIHHRNAHNIGVTYKCNYCERIFVTKSERKRHELGIHLQQRDFKCENCDKAFVTKGQMLVHSNTHSTEPPVRCKLCNKIVSRRDTYKRHMKTQHAEEFRKIIARAEARKLKVVAENTTEKPIKKSQPTPKPVPKSSMAPVEPEPETLIIDPNVEIEVLELIDIEEYVEEQGRIEFEGLAEQIPNMPVHSNLDDDQLKDLVSELLEALLDASTLDEFNHPETPISEVLVKIIESCGSEPIRDEPDKTIELRENVKMFLNLVMDSEYIQSLLNNHNVDEVVQYILKYLKADY